MAAFFGIFIPMIFAETMLRVFPQLSSEIDLVNGQPVVKHNILPYILPDRTIGYRLKPGLKAQIRALPYDADGYYTLNAGPDGFRVSTERPGEVRMAFLGDSFAFGLGVDDEHTFPEIFGNMTGFNVKNFALPGANLSMMAEIFEKEVLKWRPKHVVWTIFEANDFFDNHLFDEWKTQNSNKNFYSELLTRGESKTGFFHKLQIFLSNHFMVSSVFKEPARMFLRYLYDVPSPSTQFQKVNIMGNDHEMLFSYFNSLLTLQSGTQAEYISHTERQAVFAALEKVHSLCQKRGISLTIVLVPIREHVYAHLSHHPRAAEISLNSHNVADEILQSFLRGKDSIQYLNVLNHFWTLAEKSPPLYFKVDGHMNARGNEELAKLFRNFWSENFANRPATLLQNTP